MKIQPYVEKLEKSKEYVLFREKYPSAFMIAGFFVIDFEANKNLHQIDFYVPEEKKIAAFTLDNEVKMQLMGMLENQKIPAQLDMSANIDIDALPGILKDGMHNRSISEEIRKMIAVIQTVDGKKIWNINCVLSGMELLKSHIDDESKTVLKMERSSMMDLIKRFPKGALPKAKPTGKDAVKEELNQLNKIEEQLKKEKDTLQKKLEEEKK